jgi:hypothetical protein
MKALFLFLILAASSFSQSTVEPIRVSITMDARDPHHRAIAKYFRAELTKVGRVAIVSENSPQHFNFVVAAAPISEGGPCRGVSGALIVSGANQRNNLSVHVGDQYQTLAQAMVEKLEEEYFRVDVNGDGFVGPRSK